MSNRLAQLLAATAVFALSTPAQGGENPSKQVTPVAQAVQSTVTVLPGVRLTWSSPTSGTIVSSREDHRADVSRSRIVSKDTSEVVYYVDFS